MVRLSFSIILTLLSVAACVTETKVIKADLTQGQGVYVVGFTERIDIRIRLEDQLVSDLKASNMIARASHLDIANITRSTRKDVVAQANAQHLLAVLLINQVAADASDSVVEDPKRISPTHPDLQAFYEHANTNSPSTPKNDQRVFAEINLFIVDGDDANLFWSGTTWSVNADGQGGAISDVSQVVVDQLAAVRSQFVAD
jgi:hypothetical protein